MPTAAASPGVWTHNTASEPMSDDGTNHEQQKISLPFGQSRVAYLKDAGRSLNKMWSTKKKVASTNLFWNKINKNFIMTRASLKGLISQVFQESNGSSIMIKNK